MTHDRSLVGQQIGSYILTAQVQSGTYGSVYQARHAVFDDDPLVALKLLHTHLNSPEEQRGFLQEAKLLRKLRHPYVLPIIDAGIHQGQPFLATEYATGGSLYERIRKQAGNPFQLETALQLISQIGEALHYAHQQAVIHRDLKPGNILFNARGEALLADFGIAVVLETASTRKMGLGGTPAYMAPEQFEGYVSPKSDQYALACVAYELLTGCRPFAVSAPSLEAYWFQHTKVPPTAPRERNPALPADCETALLTALAKERSHRYPDVAAFLKAISAPLEAVTHYAPASAPQQPSLPPTLSASLNPPAFYPHTTAHHPPTHTPLPAHPLTETPGMSASDYNRQGNKFYSLGFYQEALAVYDEAIRLASRNVLYYTNKGFTLNKLRRYNEALEMFETALRLNPKHEDARVGRDLVLEILSK
ncbi:serine/threonine-protein kinase [Ktedonobacter racemifer]|uniref:non-specific serine/threonine protein kinase n=1 Tax=Ktedonobacter racemifer DSM 44963 TaxID=485913 RepID=D6TLG5_KTERA|nr:serine/threonine-protein kinase [Ktedonobacter racemifer]EFH86615.1 serine/threonine protein kinase with TPR repeats [Ktedonobacter racemifer DSM 44963]